LTIARAAGEVVGLPTVNGIPDTRSLAVNPLVTTTGQNVEYAISTDVNADVSALTWQTGTTFIRSFTDTTYYVYARSVENFDHFAGTPVRSAGTTFHTVTFNSMGGNFTPQTQIVLNGQTSEIPANNPARSGFGFVGWFTDEVSGSLWNFNTPVTANMTLYARWNSNQIFSINFTQIIDMAPEPIASGLTISQSGAAGQQSEATITLPALSDGYTYGNIQWLFSNHTGTHTLGISNSIVLSYSDVRINAVGDNKIISLIVELIHPVLGSSWYSRQISFNVVP
jgi:uncharacterized repeat protein (TIGR02543 family)